MRQGQQNRRGRGRNRKSQNPLTRSFESNGPDIKIRGTPSHIAEKYISLARDALASGDPVLAENYLQHAEHYNRIIMTYREQQVAHGDGVNGSGGGNGRHRPNEHGDSDDAAADAEEVPPGQEPQPTLASDSEAPEAAPERPQRRSNGARGNSRRRRNDANGSDERSAESGSNNGNGGADEAPTRRSPRRQESFAEGDDQPEFLKRPVRRPRKSAAASESAAGDDAATSSADEVAE